MSTPRIVFLVHGGSDSIEAVRARGLSQNHPVDKVHFLWRETARLATAKIWHHQIKALKPDLLYVINTALPGAPLTCWWQRFHGLPFVLDTGDVIYEMARHAGTAATWKLPLLRWVESRTQRAAHIQTAQSRQHQIENNQIGHKGTCGE